MERLIPLEKACVMLGAHPNSVRAWEEKGRIRVIYTVGGKRRIPESKILRPSIVTSFSGRLYGLRSHAKARALMQAVQTVVTE